MSHRPLLITRAEVRGHVVDVRIEGGRVAAVGADLARLGATTVDAGGGALLPGLHDHHLHLLAMAAARRSLDAALLADPRALDDAIRARHRELPADRWLRVVGIDDRHGRLDRARLDALAPERRVRAQHRSGAAWALSSPALAAVGETSEDGWLHRHDAELGRRWADDAPDLAPVGHQLARHGVTGVTDATPFDDPTALLVLSQARAAGALAQRVVAMGGPALATASPPAGVDLGPVKVLVADDALPSIEQLATWFRAAHDAGRAVAVHCVTRVGLVLALAAWAEGGARVGDRIEHGSVIPVELIATIADLGLAVVTQPAFLRARGDAYLAEVEPDDVPHLYRCGSLVAAGIAVALSTDAPFGPANPWLALATAVDRRTATGASIGPGEALAPIAALDRLLSAPLDPGGPPRRIEVGAPADLCLLGRPLAAVLDDPPSAPVRATWIDGRVVHGDEPG